MFAKVGAAVMLNRKRLVSRPFLLDNNTMAYSFGAQLDTKFGKTLFDTIYLPSLVQVGALPSYNATDINELEVKVPKLDEQSKIGLVFSNIDNLITLHQRKYDKLVNTKKALLDKMFPKAGEVTPKLRFRGFTDTWEQCELGNIGTTYTGLSGKNSNDFGHGEAKYVTYLNVFGNPISNPEMIEKVEIDKSQNQVVYGDVFFTTSSETPEEVGMSSIWLSNEKNTYLNSFCFG
ncbi:restriction endonuclease subunit S, partial [Clostridium sp.]|uniref:restriction endonuclease subunit S n=1 Tax=Clostridium sp. TaxID=1506 RepID=UPI0035A14EC7